ncbi:MAG: radical SAM protein [Thermodesulfovibrionales bacterium]
MDLFPDVLRIESVGLCNFRCIHCPTGTEPNKRPKLTREQFNIILNQLSVEKFIPRVVVLYHGGEPLLNKDLEYFIKRLKNLGVQKTVITTNASSLTEERAINIIEMGLDEMKVSFDGESPEENNLIRRNANFYQNALNLKGLLRIRKKLGKQNPVVKISNVRICDKSTLDNLNRAGNFSFNNPPRYLIDYFKDELSEVQFQSFPAMVWPGFRKFGNLSSVSYAREKPIYCGPLFETITILTNGNVVPCCLDLKGEEVLGNVFETNIFKIFGNDKYATFKRNFTKRRYSNLCLKCYVVTPHYLCNKKKAVKQ